MDVLPKGYDDFMHIHSKYLKCVKYGYLPSAIFIDCTKIYAGFSVNFVKYYFCVLHIAGDKNVKAVKLSLCPGILAQVADPVS